MKRNHYVYRITNTRINKHYYGSRTTEMYPKDDIGFKYFSSSRDKSFILDQKENPQDYKYKVIRIFNTRKEALELEIIFHNRFNVGKNNKFYNLAKQSTIGRDTTGIVQAKNIITNEKISISKEEFDKRDDLVGVTKGRDNTKDINNKNRGLKGDKNPFYGKKHSKDSLALMLLSNIGRKASKETKLKMSNTRKGVKKSEEHKSKIGRKGLVMLQNRNTLEIIRINKLESEKLDLNLWVNPKVITPEKKYKCKYCAMVTIKGSLVRWHNDNCKHKPVEE